MRLVVAVVLLGACGFQPGHAVSPTGDATGSDARGDGPVDTFVYLDGSGSGSGSSTVVEVQAKDNTKNSAMTVAVTMAAETPGDLNVVAVGWFNSGTLVGVTDSAGNVYTAGMQVSSSSETLVIYYKCGITALAGTNTVTATFVANGQDAAIRAVEFSGLKTSACFEGNGVNSGSSGFMMSASFTSAHAHDLLFGATFQLNTVMTGDASYTVLPNDSFGDLAEYREVMTPGTYTANATENMSGAWTMVLAAFEAN